MKKIRTRAEVPDDTGHLIIHEGYALLVVKRGSRRTLKAVIPLEEIDDILSDGAPRDAAPYAGTSDQQDQRSWGWVASGAGD